jgi:hypothetical protein
MADYRFKVEFVDQPTKEALWFDDREEVDAVVKLLKSPSGGPPVRLRVTEYVPVRTEIV